MFSHIMIGSNDVDRSKKFYDAIFGTLGVAPATPDARGRLAYAHNGGRFMVTKPIDGKPAGHANGGTIGFLMSSPEQAKAWHDAGVANGGATAEDPPGIRQGAAGQMYLAYLRDPDGHKLCGLHRVPS
ncbi:MAG TPA: VOC family protein [Stellaceae bacterium]|jgi:catechol 2,3-dioxygenase-like lactoylglutathione lyase family enzyme|nr:VOC family protein [Stellaceae bacterium]